ncbi:MAG: hypothetical protein GXO23_05085 [Crenarchaeota archaeon]|nr:hypothetical protein [Thermoproteota archaeon]
MTSRATLITALGIVVTFLLMFSHGSTGLAYSICNTRACATLNSYCYVSELLNYWPHDLPYGREVTVHVRLLASNCKVRVNSVKILQEEGLIAKVVNFSHELYSNIVTITLDVKPTSLGKTYLKLEISFSPEAICDLCLKSSHTTVVTINFTSYAVVRVVASTSTGSILRDICIKVNNYTICGEGSAKVYSDNVIVSAPKTVSINSFEKYAFKEWSNDENKNVLELKVHESSINLTAIYRKEYYIDITTPRKTLFVGWFPEGTNLRIEIPYVINVSNGIVEKFLEWNCTRGKLPSIPVLDVIVNKPLICEAKYETLYKVLIIVMLDNSIKYTVTKWVKPYAKIMLNSSNYIPNSLLLSILGASFKGWRVLKDDTSLVLKKGLISLVIDYPTKIYVLWSPDYEHLIPILLIVIIMAVFFVWMTRPEKGSRETDETVPVAREDDQTEAL